MYLMTEKKNTVSDKNKEGEKRKKRTFRNEFSMFSWFYLLNSITSGESLCPNIDWNLFTVPFPPASIGFSESAIVFNFLNGEAGRMDWDFRRLVRESGRRERGMGIRPGRETKVQLVLEEEWKRLQEGKKEQVTFLGKSPKLSVSSPQWGKAGRSYPRLFLTSLLALQVCMYVNTDLIFSVNPSFTLLCRHWCQVCIGIFQTWACPKDRSIKSINIQTNLAGSMKVLPLLTLFIE